MFVEAWHDLELQDRVVRDQRTPGECRRRAFKAVPGGGSRDIEGKKTTFKVNTVKVNDLQKAKANILYNI